MDRFKQYFIFTIIGGTGSAIAIALTYLFTEFFNIWYLFSYMISALLAWTFNFYLHSLVTFRGHNQEQSDLKYIKFIILYVVAFTINAILVYILTSLLGIYYLISIVFVTILISFFTFLWSKNKIFIF